MPRIARLLPEEGVLHVISRGNNRGLLFHDPEDFKAYLSFLKDLQSDHPFSLYHFCLMNTHVHLLLDVNPNTRLSDFMKRLSLLYTHFITNKNIATQAIFGKTVTKVSWLRRISIFWKVLGTLKAIPSRPAWSKIPKIGPGPVTIPMLSVSPIR